MNAQQEGTVEQREECSSIQVMDESALENTKTAGLRSVRKESPRGKLENIFFVFFLSIRRLWRAIDGGFAVFGTPWMVDSPFLARHG